MGQPAEVAGADSDEGGEAYHGPEELALSDDWLDGFFAYVEVSTAINHSIPLYFVPLPRQIPHLNTPLNQNTPRTDQNPQMHTARVIILFQRIVAHEGNQTE